MVAECSVSQRSYVVKPNGDIRSINVGMSNIINVSLYSLSGFKGGNH